VPLPRLSLIVATAVQAAAAVAMILGLWVGWAALALIAFTLASTPVFHNFWDFQGEERRLKGIPFRSNVIVLGGLAAMLAVGF
jgi:putative oxidoreductase